MSGKELVEQYQLDLEDLQNKTLRFDRSDYITRLLKKHRKKQSIILTKGFTSWRGNNYLGILIYTRNSTTSLKSWELSSYHIGLIITAKGISAIAFYAESNQAIRFNPHFFRRYKERFAKVCDWETRNSLEAAKGIIDVIGIYMTRNLSMTWLETKSVFRDNVHVFGPVNDGVALLQWNKSHKLLQANTFVTMDMLDDKQTEMVEYAKIYCSLSKDERAQLQFPDFISND